MATPVNESSTKQELVQYIREKHGVEPDLDKTQRQLVKMVKELDGSVPTESATETKKEEAVVAAPRSDNSSQMLNEAQTKAVLDKQRKVRITIHSTSEPNGQGDVYLGINGRAYVLQREVEITVPMGVVNVLNDAKRKVYKQGADGELIEKTVHSYPFSILGDAKIGD